VRMLSGRERRRSLRVRRETWVQCGSDCWGEATRFLVARIARARRDELKV
jgi:hypothetical protein